MPLLNYLQLQPIDANDDAASDDAATADDTITLEDRPDEAQLEAFWDNVVKDVENDPNWFSFTDE